jgi:hypothetical protein
MKKQKLLILSLAALSGLVLTGCDLTPDHSSKEDVPASSVIDDAVETSDALGTKIALSAVTPTKAVNMSSVFGYQTLDRTATTVSIRLIAVVDDYKNLTGVSVTSKVVSPRSDKNTAGDSEETIKDEQEFSVSSVYSSLKDDATWTGTIDSSFTKKYYVIYTLKNIPVAHWYDTVIVRFKASSTTDAEQTFIVNAYGLIGNDSRLTVSEITTGEYKITGCTATKGSDICVNGDYLNVADQYATKAGAITTLAYGAFKFTYTTTLGKIVLPDTITTIANSAFRKCTISELNIPSSVVSATSDSFYYYTSEKVTVQTLYYNATNLACTSVTGLFANNIVVGANVTSLPKLFFNKSNAPESIKFLGTESAWNSMRNSDNKDNGFFYAKDGEEIATCVDTSYSKVTFHYGAGTLGDNTGDVEVKARNGRTINNPGNPVPASGFEFKGWYTGEDHATEFDFTAPITANADIYAWYDTPASGYSMANPLAVSASASNSFTATLYPGKEYEYIKFTVPETAAASDWYYFQVDTSSSVRDSVNSTASISGSIAIYTSTSESDAVAIDTTSSGCKLANTAIAQTVDGSDLNYVRLYAAPGATYYIKAGLTGASDASSSKYCYGTLAMKLFTFDNDSVDEALDMTVDTAVSPTPTSKDQRVLYKFAAESSKLMTIKSVNTNSVYTYVYVVDYAASSREVIANESYGAGFEISFNAVAGHNYYVEVYQTSVGKSYTLTLNEAPQGYNSDKPLDYTIGTTVSVDRINSYINTKTSYEAGSFYTFTTTESKLYSISTTNPSSNYKNKVVIYDSTGKAVDTATSDSTGKAITGHEVTLASGTYTMSVEYLGSSSYNPSVASTWTTFDFTMKEVFAGDSLALPEAIDEEMQTLAGSVNGKFYKFTATADNYLVIDLTNLPKDATAVLLTGDGKGTDLKAEVDGKLVYKTVTGTSYILKIYGADGDATYSFSRADSIEIGRDASTAYTLDFVSGIAGITGYVDNDAVRNVWFKFTVDKDATYKVFFQATLNGNGATSGADTSLSLYDSIANADSRNPMTPTVDNADDKSAHPETLGTPNGAYYEFALTAGTYYAYASLPRPYTNYDTLKLGVKEKTAGSAYDVATDLGEVTSSAESLTAKTNTDGYWSKFTLASADNLKLSMDALDAGTVTAKVYSASDTSTPLGTFSSGNGSLSASLAAGTYYVALTSDSDVTASEASIKIAHETTSYYSSSTTGGTDSGSNSNTTLTATDASYAWKDCSDESGVLMSGCKGVGRGKSILTYTFTQKGTFSFAYAFDSENKWDYLYISHTSGETTSQVMNGKTSYDSVVSDYKKLTWHALSVSVEAGDTINFIYLKDSGGNSGLDAAYLKVSAFIAA